MVFVVFQDQDHYAVLGLRKFRYKATDDDIKKACECCCTELKGFFRYPWWHTCWLIRLLFHTWMNVVNVDTTPFFTPSVSSLSTSLSTHPWQTAWWSWGTTQTSAVLPGRRWGRTMIISPASPRHMRFLVTPLSAAHGTRWIQSLMTRCRLSTHITKPTSSRWGTFGILLFWVWLPH